MDDGPDSIFGAFGESCKSSFGEEVNNEHSSSSSTNNEKDENVTSSSSDTVSRGSKRRSEENGCDWKSSKKKKSSEFNEGPENVDELNSCNSVETPVQGDPEFSLGSLKEEVEQCINSNSPSYNNSNDAEADDDKISVLSKIRQEIGASSDSPRITVHTVEALEVCLHEVAVPPGVEFQPLKKPTGKPSKSYKFNLDPFQKEAILCIENNESVLVSAHTSAGKTVVAEYSIAKALKLKQRVIYTTPIKALSNQKYREFEAEFKDVGLVTGDVTINPSAGCLIMTTEILRNMLYRGSEVMREVSWVIFDEIHYMRDKFRGVVWEETLILLPDNVHFVFLSATIPNARQFAEWVAHVHNQPCHVVYTEYRPTPLQHYLFPVGGEGIHLIVDEKGVFHENNFDSAMKLIANPKGMGKVEKRGGGNTGKENSCLKLVRMVLERNYCPAIIFSFSKKECEVYAMQMAKLDFNTSDEKKLVDEVFNSAMDILSEEDRALPQVENVLPLLRRGIGIHHGGLLPILKETIEVLFSEGLIKALFATETFAMGLNMPAKTVIFTTIRKFDGRDNRFLTSGEYIQMSGRAGRRGLDDKGIVITMLDEQMTPSIGRDLLQGSADPLNSAFHLTYNMILNLIRVEDINPEYLLERSFFQFQNHSLVPFLQEKIRKLEKEYDSIVVPNEKCVKEYYDLAEMYDECLTEYTSFIHKSPMLKAFLQPGRLIKIKIKDNVFDWCSVLKCKLNTRKSRNPTSTAEVLSVDVLVRIDPTSSVDNPKPCPPGTKPLMEIVSIMHTNIIEISAIRMFIPADLRPPERRMEVCNSIIEISKRFEGDLPLVNPVQDLDIKHTRFKTLASKLVPLKEKLKALDKERDSDFDECLEKYKNKVSLQKDIENTFQELKQSFSLLQMDELKCRKRVLKRLGFCTEADVIELKGRVACEVSSGDELLLTEMIFSGVFNGLTVPQAVALLSCFVCDEKSNEHLRMTDELSKPLREMKEIAKRIVRICTEAKLDIVEDNYIDQFKPFLMDPVYAWCNGATFSDVCKMTDIFEGSIIRSIRRLEELLRQLVQAAKTLGNSDLEVMFSEGIRLIKRDIVFAASLYI